MLNRQLLRNFGETKQPLPPAPMPAMWQCMSRMPAGTGSTGRYGRAGRQIQPKTMMRTPAKIILWRRANGGFVFNCFMLRSCNNSRGASELIKLFRALKKVNARLKADRRRVQLVFGRNLNDAAHHFPTSWN